MKLAIVLVLPIFALAAFWGRTAEVLRRIGQPQGYGFAFDRAARNGDKLLIAYRDQCQSRIGYERREISHWATGDLKDLKWYPYSGTGGFQAHPRSGFFHVQSNSPPPSFTDLPLTDKFPFDELNKPAPSDPNYLSVYDASFGVGASGAGKRTTTLEFLSPDPDRPGYWRMAWAEGPAQQCHPVTTNIIRVLAVPGLLAYDVLTLPLKVLLVALCAISGGCH